MSNFSIDLLKSLENKLKSANIRSPYLRSTVGRSRNRLDINDFNIFSDENDENNLSKQLLFDLQNESTGGKVNITIKVDAKNISNKDESERLKMDTVLTRLKNIHFDQQEDFIEHGTRSFGFGYPLLAFKSSKDKNRTLLSPLFIWSMDINPLPNNHNAFKITREPDAPIMLNPQLLVYLQMDQGIILESIDESYFDNACLTRTEIDELLKGVSKILNAKIMDLDSPIEKINDLDYYAKLVHEQKVIFNSGIFTLFKSNKESIVNDYEKMIAGYDDLMFDDPDIYLPYQKDYFAAVQLDPSQEGIIRNLSEHKRVIIQGPPGTGKSNSLTGIILNALENNAKILVVCEKKTALEVILENLTEKNMDNFSMVLDNVSSDRQKMVRDLRDKFDNRAYETNIESNSNNYDNSKNQFERFYKLIQERYDNLLSKVMGDLTWKECIGNYLKAKRESSNAATLKPKIQTSFSFDEATFFNTLNKIKDHTFLYENTAEHLKTFEFIKEQMFQEQLSTERIRRVQEDFEAEINSLTALNEKWEKIYLQESETSFQKLLEPSIFIKIGAIFNKTKKEKISFIKNLTQESEKLIISLKSKYSINDPKNKYEIGEQIKEFLSKLNNANEEINQLRVYYEYKNHYFTKLNEDEREIVDKLKKYKTSKWEALFRQWFFNQILLQKEKSLGEFPTDARALNEIIKLDQDIDNQQSSSISQIWYENQRNAMKNRTLKDVRMTFNLRKNSRFSRRNSLRSLMHEEFDLITSFYPVLLMNPSVCSSILPFKQGLFDLVIFDEASQLRLEDTFPALLRGRFQVISGDIHQMPPSTHFGSKNDNGISEIEDLEDDVVYSEEESLLTYAQNSDYEFNYLDFHYRSQHPHLIDFSNAAFYGKRLVPMPPTFTGKPIIFRQVNGVYTDNKNNGEADEILRIIFDEIHADENGNYPSIGIATLNTTQQRFIWEKIWELADKSDEHRTKLAKLEEAGLFVKNLENIQGDQRDIIIISTTFGIREDGRFIQNYGPLNQDKGYKLLNVIVTRAKQQLYLLTSIPQEYYSNYRNDIVTKGNTGKGIFYAYINYAKICAEGNEESRIELLNFLQEQQGETNKNTSPQQFLTESVFEEEVLQELLKFVPSSAIETQFKLGGFRLDIVIKNKAGAPNIVIECDGKTYHSSKVAYRYDMHRQKILERHGLKVYRIWSTNWWRDKNREVKKIKRYITDNEK